MLQGIFEDIKQQVLRTSCFSGERLIIFDRWTLISDIVYEKYCYNRESVCAGLLDDLRRVCVMNHIYLIYFRISEEEMVKRFKLRGDKLRTIEEAKITRNAYEEFIKNCSIPNITIDVTDKTSNEVYEQLKQFIKEELEIA
jgi:thymidylate kinase